MSKRKKEENDRLSESVYSKEQLLGSKTLGFPRDIVEGILKDGDSYTKQQDIRLIKEFLERKV